MFVFFIERCVVRGLDYVVESTLLHELVHVHLRQLGEDDVDHTGAFLAEAARLKEEGYPHPLLTDEAADAATAEIRGYWWRCRCGHLACFTTNRKPGGNYGRHLCAGARWTRVVSIFYITDYLN